MFLVEIARELFRMREARILPEQLSAIEMALARKEDPALMPREELDMTLFGSTDRYVQRIDKGFVLFQEQRGFLKSIALTHPEPPADTTRVAYYDSAGKRLDKRYSS